MDAGEKENAATMVSSSDGIASKMNMEITEEKQPINVDLNNSDDHKMGNGENNVTLQPDEIPSTLILGKRKHEEAVEKDAKKHKCVDESNNGHTSDCIEKPMCDNQISSSDDIVEEKNGDGSDGNCESSAIVSHENGDSITDKEPSSISQSATNEVTITYKAEVETTDKNEVEISAKTEDKVTGNNEVETSTTEVNVKLTQKSDVPKDELNSSVVVESNNIKEAPKTNAVTVKVNVIEKLPVKTELKPESINETSPEDEADDLLERLDAIDPAFLRKPDLKLEEIDKTDLEKDDLLTKLEEAANGDSSDEIKEDKKSTKEIYEVDSIEQQLECLSDESVPIVVNANVNVNKEKTKKCSKTENVIITKENILENDIEMSKIEPKCEEKSSDPVIKASITDSLSDKMPQKPVCVEVTSIKITKPDVENVLTKNFGNISSGSGTIVILDSDSDENSNKAAESSNTRFSENISRTTEISTSAVGNISIKKPGEEMKVKTDKNLTNGPEIAKNMAAQLHKEIQKDDKENVNAEIVEEKMEVDSNETVEGSILDISDLRPEVITYQIKTSMGENNNLNYLRMEINDTSDKPEVESSDEKIYKLKGNLELCNFFIDYFTKMKKTCQKQNASDSSYLDTSFESPQKGKSFSRTKGATKKQSKNLSSSTPTTKGADEFVVPAADNLYDAKKQNVNVLARWVDKKFYAGKILQAKPGNKYVVQFEDGATKTLSTDAIIFGNDISLPLLDQFVHALTATEEYEPGLVTSIDIEDGNVIYTVIAESKTVQVPCSDIYLDLDQAKIILDLQKTNPPTIDTTALTAEVVTTPIGRTKRTSKGGVLQSPVPGFSGGVQGKKSGRRGRRPQPHSESSDVSDIVDSEPNSPEQRNALEGVDGVQPELQTTSAESELNKIALFQDYIKSTGKDSLVDLLGPIPSNKSLFRNKHFILTCTIPMKTVASSDAKDDLKNKHKKFTALPFIKEHLRSQIIEGGGKVYEHFEDIPKNKYKQCKIIAPNPCITAKYIQCLAAEIPALSHEWIIESCQKGVLAETKSYVLPSGWSIIEESYIKWAVGRNADQRSNSTPLTNQIILMASFNKDFIDFWTRVCKLAGATIRIIKSIADVNQGLTGVMLTDEDFPQEIKLKAEHFSIPIVSNVWVVQSLIAGKPCKPDSHEKFQRNYQDDDF